MVDRFKMWKAKRIHKRLLYYEEKQLKFQHYVDKIKLWKKETKNELNKHLQTMTSDEVMLFGVNEGYITKNN